MKCKTETEILYNRNTLSVNLHKEKRARIIATECMYAWDYTIGKR
ncbi:hypothetical protein QA601_10510 [Chitinispirillales bacterium ANBcel5]|nr:hypothetical protein [Chitinispirillales bacterium ANBcel5]